MSFDQINLAARLRAAAQAVQVGRLADALQLVEGVRNELEAHVAVEQTPTIPAPPPECETCGGSGRVVHDCEYEWCNRLEGATDPCPSCAPKGSCK